jgi:hypothetical protein
VASTRVLLLLVSWLSAHQEALACLQSVNELKLCSAVLQVRLNGVATFIGKVGLSVAVLVFLILFIR